MRTNRATSFSWAIGCMNENIRGRGWARGWNGMIDEVSIYNRALSASEITTIFSADSAGNSKLPHCVARNLQTPGCAP
ncbi:MAG: hypothetical protein NTW21_37155 [Verrucomicrobia bacterium]|nr:hypothetical protein [Verrucomicrobiota bacterium]